VIYSIHDEVPVRVVARGLRGQGDRRLAAGNDRGGPVHRIRSLPATLCAAAALLLTGVVTAGPAIAVAHGVAATPGQFPFAVKLVMTDIPDSSGGSYGSACSGALISPTWIITAGHCFHDADRTPVSGAVPYPTTATFNTVTTDPAERGAVTRDVDVVQQSPSADIAVAHLTGSTTVSPLHLATTEPSRGELVTLAGWGSTTALGSSPSDQLHWGRMTVGSHTSTTVSVTGHYPARDTSACVHDSGAPYLGATGSAPLLVATESNGPDCPHATPETTARVDDQVPWIRGVVTDLPLP
jgi:secreted trypsin-like serine protease